MGKRNLFEKAILKLEEGKSNFAQLKYLDAVDCFRKAIKLLPKGNDELLGYLLNIQGIVLKKIGKYREAELSYKHSLNVRERILGEEHPDIAISLNNLAELYRDQGNYSQAELLYKKALLVMEKTKGTEHPFTASVLSNIANLYYNLGNYTQTEPLYERALAIQQKILGKEHPDTTLTLNGLAGLYRAQGHYEQAISLLKSALDIWTKVYDEEHLATGYHNLGSLYYDYGDYTEARFWYKGALNIWEKIYHNGEHFYIAIVIYDLGTLYYKQGVFAEAESFYDRSLAIFEKTVGIEHPNCAMLFGNLANLYRNQGKYAHAQQLYERALMTLKKNFDSEHPQVSYTSRSLLELEKRIIELEKQKNEQQAELERQRRLAFLGEMATAVAHQINQPVGIIRASTSAARSDIEDHLFQTEEIKPLLDKIWQQTERLHKIIDTFRRFARSDRSLQEPVHLNAVIRQTIELFDEQFEQYHIELIPQLTTTDLMVHSNSSLIQEILINLLTNARDALKNQNNATVWITSWQQDNMAHFQVSDNGPGIPETIRPHIFTPFHSTKSTEHGTGLGLYICDKVIKELNGTISYTDRPEGGGCFSITLPQLME